MDRHDGRLGPGDRAGHDALERGDDVGRRPGREASRVPAIATPPGSRRCSTWRRARSWSVPSIAIGHRRARISGSASDPTRDAYSIISASRPRSNPRSLRHDSSRWITGLSALRRVPQFPRKKPPSLKSRIDLRRELTPRQFRRIVMAWNISVFPDVYLPSPYQAPSNARDESRVRRPSPSPREVGERVPEGRARVFLAFVPGSAEVRPILPEISMSLRLASCVYY